MQVGVYGSGYLGTVISACLADFGTPVSCCHADSSRMVEMAQGNVPFFEKNLKEVIRRNVRAGRLIYSTDVESFSRRTYVIFLAEDSPTHLEDLVLRIARLANKPPVLAIVTPVSVGTASIGDSLRRGEKIGLIKFGSRVDVLVEPCVDLKVNPGDRTRAGSSILGISRPRT